MHIVFFIPSPHGERIREPGYAEEHPLGGTETSVLRLAAALRRRGHEVQVEAEPEKLRGLRADVFVAVRDWRFLLARDIEAGLRYYWAHDDADQAIFDGLEDPATAGRVWGRCDGIGLVSRYQRRRFAERLHLPPGAAPHGQAFLAGNGVEPGTVLPEAEAGTAAPRARRCYYASTPFRGLEVLLKAWPAVRDAVPDAELAVFSSLRVYNTPGDDPHEPLYALARGLPGVTYHGAVGQRRLREEARRCRALAYPCTFAETSCLTAMEAMAAGCAVVATDLGALPETAWRNPLVAADPGWAHAWVHELCRVLLDDRHYAGLARHNLNAARAFDCDAEAGRWIERIEFDLARKRA